MKRVYEFLKNAEVYYPATVEAKGIALACRLAQGRL